MYGVMYLFVIHSIYYVYVYILIQATFVESKLDTVMTICFKLPSSLNGPFSHQSDHMHLITPSTGPESGRKSRRCCTTHRCDSGHKSEGKGRRAHFLCSHPGPAPPHHQLNCFYSRLETPNLGTRQIGDRSINTVRVCGASSPGHSLVLRFQCYISHSACNIENVGVAWG